MASTFRKPNPALSRAFNQAVPTPGAETMTIEGTVVKTGLLLLLLTIAAMGGWQLSLSLGLMVAPVMLGAIVVSFVLSLVIAFKPHLAPVLAIPYTLIKGTTVGIISQWYALTYGGTLILNAVGLTIAITAALLLAYGSGLIRPSENVKLGIVAATGGIMIFYLVTIVAGLFGFQMPLVNSNGTFGIVFSVVVVCLAAANLVLDFDFIETGVERGLDKRIYEWYGAFGLMVTIVWLYLEILRLLAKLQSRR